MTSPSTSLLSKEPSEYTPAELSKAISLLIKEQATRLNNVAGDTGAAIVNGTGKVDIRPFDGHVQIAIECEFGWVTHRFDVVAACGASAAICSILQAMFATAATQSEISNGQVSIQ